MQYSLQLNLLEALRSEAANCRTLVVSSSEIYGEVGPEELPIRKTHPLGRPIRIGVSKVVKTHGPAILDQSAAADHPGRSFPHIGQASLSSLSSLRSPNKSRKLSRDFTNR